MTLESTRKRPGLHYIEAPRWVDIAAQLWLIILAVIKWLQINNPRAQVYVLTRYDLARRRLIPSPLVAVFLSSAIVCLALHWACNAISLMIRIEGGLCLT